MICGFQRCTNCWRGTWGRKSCLSLQPSLLQQVSHFPISCLSQMQKSLARVVYCLCMTIVSLSNGCIPHCENCPYILVLGQTWTKSDTLEMQQLIPRCISPYNKKLLVLSVLTAKHYCTRKSAEVILCRSLLHNLLLQSDTAGTS